MAIETWAFDKSHSGIEFWVRHLMVSKVRGRFTRWDGQVELDAEDPRRSSVEVRIDASSIETGDAKRDAHLRSPDFFDAAKFPELVFKSRRVEPDGRGRYRVTGDLTLRDVTREVTLEVEDLGRVRDMRGGERAGFSAKTAIDRKQFGLGWNVVLETGGVLVGDQINIELELELQKAAAQKAA
jgi:polyisoprenoid-binding protein YceI